MTKLTERTLKMRMKKLAKEIDYYQSNEATAKMGHGATIIHWDLEKEYSKLAVQLRIGYGE